MDTKVVLFDLDGTLLPMDQDLFLKTYFESLVAKLVPYGYQPEQLVKAIWQGTGAMIQNNGTRKNEDAFWECFLNICGEQAKEDYSVFEDFYNNEFDSIKKVCGFNSKASEIITYIKMLGFRVALATNPLFPAIATETRMKWAGISPEEFELYTTYENSHYCKPNLQYYAEIIEKLGVKPEECLMVGNDVGDDMVVQEMGMKVFLLTDCLINKDEVDIEAFPHGGFEELKRYIDELESNRRTNR